VKVIEVNLLSPCVVQRYRGSVQRTEGVRKKEVNKKEVIIPGSFFSLLKKNKRIESIIMP